MTFNPSSVVTHIVKSPDTLKNLDAANFLMPIIYTL